MKKNYFFYPIWSGDIENNLISDIKLYKPKNVVICAAEEFHIDIFELEKNIEELEYLLEKYDTQMYIIINGLNSEEKYIFPKKNTTIIFWPMFYALLSINTFYDTLLESEHLWSENNKIDKSYISLNSRPKTHRAMLIDKLSKNNLLDIGYVSWLESNYSCDYDFKYWKKKKLILTDKNIEPWKSFPLEYRKAFVNIISESDVDIQFITEKTFHAILIEQPFIVLGSVNYHKLLVEYGFELYDEIFDYSFDSNPDLNYRIDAIIENINKIKNENFYELRKIIENKIKKNKKHLLDIYHNKKFIPDFVKFIYDKHCDDFPYNFVYDNTLPTDSPIFKILS